MFYKTQCLINLDIKDLDVMNNHSFLIKYSEHFILTTFFTILYLINLNNYLLFHSIIEIFSIIVAGTIFLISWHSRKHLQNNYLTIIGIAFAFTAIIDLIHTLATPGMGVFTGFDTNLMVQTWILARYLQATSLLLAPLLHKRKINYSTLPMGYLLYTAIGLYSLFIWNNFPDCFIEGQGLTPFKINSEYIISGIMTLALYLFFRIREKIDKTVYQVIAWAIITTIFSELMFTSYSSLFQFSNYLGHTLKLFAYYLFYKALIKTGIEDPYRLIFMELSLSEERLAQQNYQLLELDELKSRFIVTATHELRTPVTSILGFVDFMLNDDSMGISENVRHNMEIVLRNAQRLSTLTNDLLVLQRIQTGRLEISPGDYDLVKLVNDICEELSPLIDEKEQRLLLESPENLIVFGDRTRICQLVVNLLGNANKFTPEGGEISVCVERQSDQVHVQVMDSGIGIDSEDMGQLFKPFPGIRHGLNVKSSGLGLSICKGIVDLHKGSIWAESEGKGKGTIFNFTIPVILT